VAPNKVVGNPAGKVVTVLVKVYVVKVFEVVVTVVWVVTLASNQTQITDKTGWWGE